MEKNRHVIKAYLSPARLFLVIAASIFLIEALVMIVLPRLPVFSETTVALLDSAMLVALLSPVLYFFLFRPLLQHINERKAAEAGLVIERDRAQSYLDVAGVIIVALDENGSVALINKKGCEILGYEEYDILGRNWFTGFVPDAMWGMGKEIAAVLEKLSEPHPGYFENPVITRKGEQRHILWRYAPLVRNGAIKGVLYSGEDITERKRAEKALIESEMHYRLVHNSAFDGIIISCMNDRVLDCNLSAENIFGYERGELIGLQITSLMPPHYRQRHAEGLKRFLATGISSIQGRPLELEGLKKDGTVFPVEFTLSIFYMEGSVRFNGTIRDITERKRAESDRERMQAQINQSQKIEAVGRLAGGIAHDFNNILTTIEGNAELALEDIRSPHPALPREVGGKMEKIISDPVSARLNEIILSVKHASKLTRQLLLFSRGHPVEIIPLNINSAIENILSMLRRLIGEDIRLTTELAPDIWIIAADESSIEQVLLNLTVNARDAMPKGGSMLIKTSNVLLGENKGKGLSPLRGCEELPPGKYVSIIVRDNGSGMEKEIIPRIFEPFFTTKEAGKGTGLGLSVIYGIVKQHGGCITVESVPGGGTAFTILLPILTRFSKEPVRKPVKDATVQ
ncbi:MAG: PAS domain S-box protein [Deltaproteobacteria bacterium]|nr:PAS domain S-box protein [Deltaproteobacteria bacterium]